MKWFLYIIALLLASAPAYPQQHAYAVKAFDVADGLPQSFVSGIVQDDDGFVWIATRDGLAKYDGRKFKIFRYSHADTASLTSNIISMLHLDENNRLWIKYEQGDIDIMDTRTEVIRHVFLNGKKSISVDKIKNGHSIATDASGNHWILANDNNGIYITDDKSRKTVFYSRTALMPNNKDNYITGIASHNGRIIVTTDKALVFFDSSRKIVKTITYTFPGGSLFNKTRFWKDNSPLIRKNGQMIIADEERIIIYLPESGAFKVIALPPQKEYIPPPRFLDKNGNMYLAYNNTIFVLDVNNNLSVMPLAVNEAENRKITSLLLDASGVLWVGYNGYGLLQYDLRLKRMPKLRYEVSFHEDVIKRIHPPATIAPAFFDDISSYRFRWTADENGKIWMSKTDAEPVASPQVCYYKNNRLFVPPWKYADGNAPKYGMEALAISKSGKLWGLDYQMDPVLFDTLTYTATVYKAILNSKKDLNRVFETNGLVIDGEATFWICSNLGLIKYIHGSGRPYEFKIKNMHLLSMAQDTSDNDILWIGTYADGLIKYSKSTGTSKYYTIKNGLPNNTIYGIMHDSKGNLWCSSNKGIFLFDPKTGYVQSYTSRDGLQFDEFNRFYFFKFPNGDMAFGGTKGYTVFNPLSLSADSFQPKVAITGININNVPADYRDEGSFLSQSINSLAILELPYNKNFLSFDFAALEFNIPEKIKYRYRLKGLNDDWVMAGYDNTATYTSIPPGNYVLMINASNTNGTWSPYIKALRISIAPPFWKTWWFISLCSIVSALILFFGIRKRLRDARMIERQKIAFEIEAMNLEVKALRSQMNPHFIFNCLNSIKALIHESQNNQAIQYLTTFSRLIRNQLNNNHKEITLLEELETCKLYLQLESLRFAEKVSFNVIIPNTIDIASLLVPPLILQPFVENAVIHGILPSESGGVITISVKRKNNYIICTIDDTGIGRESANRISMDRKREHISYGIRLAHDRLALNNTLNDSNSYIEIVDKKDDHGNATGTSVLINFMISDD